MLRNVIFSRGSKGFPLFSTACLPLEKWTNHIPVRPIRICMVNTAVMKIRYGRDEKSL